MNDGVAALFNGALPESLWTQARGLHYGDGVFRTLLRSAGNWIDWDAQMAKLAGDAAVLGLESPSAAILRDEADRLVADVRDGVLKILLWRRGAARGYRGDARDCDRLLLRYPLPVYEPSCWTQGIHAYVCGLRLSSQPQLAGIKHLNRLEQVLASRDWPNSAQEGILVAAAGSPVCGTRSNVFWVRDGRLFTPELRDYGVAGLMRDRVRVLARNMEIPIETGSYPLQDLLNADEAFVTNSLIGVWPLRRLEGRDWHAPGAVTRRLAEALAHPVIAQI